MTTLVMMAFPQLAVVGRRIVNLREAMSSREGWRIPPTTAPPPLYIQIILRIQIILSIQIT